jgi:hypothetical protein
MEITKVFRCLVAALLGLFALSIALSFFEPDLPDALNAYLEGDGASPVVSIFISGPLSLQILLVTLALTFLIAFIASCIGLLIFRRWARAMFIGVAVAGFAFIFWMGVTFTTPVLTAVNTLINMINGAILVMLLFDPIKAKFARPSAPA